MWVIAFPLFGTYVERYSNSLGCIVVREKAEGALKFATKEEAQAWADRYMPGPGRTYSIIQV
jgi:hypothetical protein